MAFIFSKMISPRKANPVCHASVILKSTANKHNFDNNKMPLGHNKNTNVLNKLLLFCDKKINEKRF